MCCDVLIARKGGKNSCDESKENEPAAANNILSLAPSGGPRETEPKWLAPRQKPQVSELTVLVPAAPNLIFDAFKPR